MAATTEAARKSPIQSDTSAITSSWMTNGFFERCRISPKSPTRRACSTSLGPNRARRSSTCAEERPLSVVPSRAITASGGSAPTSRSSRSACSAVAVSGERGRLVIAAGIDLGCAVLRFSATVPSSKLQFSDAGRLHPLPEIASDPLMPRSPQRTLAVRCASSISSDASGARGPGATFTAAASHGTQCTRAARIRDGCSRKRSLPALRRFASPREHASRGQCAVARHLIHASSEEGRCTVSGKTCATG